MTQTTRSTAEIKAVHSSADYFEALLRARVVKAMKQLQQQTSINQVALGLHTLKGRTPILSRAAIEKALQPLKSVILDAYRRGGRLGATHIKSVLNGD